MQNSLDTSSPQAQVAHCHRNYCHLDTPARKILLPAEAARIGAGFTIEEAAKAARICPRYLRQVELKGAANFALSQKLARIYGCSVNVFLFKAEGGRDAALANARTRRNRVRAKYSCAGGDAA